MLFLQAGVVSRSKARLRNGARVADRVPRKRKEKASLERLGRGNHFFLYLRLSPSIATRVLSAHLRHHLNRSAHHARFAPCQDRKTRDHWGQFSALTILVSAALEPSFLDFGAAVCQTRLRVWVSTDRIQKTLGRGGVPCVCIVNRQCSMTCLCGSHTRNQPS